MPRTQYSSRSDARQRASQDFKAGFYLGLLVGLVVLCAVLFLWAIPTVDGCVEDVRQLTQQQTGVMSV